MISLVDTLPAQLKCEPDRGHKGFTQEEWEIVLQRDDFENVSQKKLRDSLVEGIPPELRGSIWSFLTKAQQLSLNFSLSVYQRLTQQTDSYVTAEIRKDIHRTFPTHPLFKQAGGVGQCALYNILSAYSNYDQEVAYCQGMGFIAGYLIMQIKDEVLCFWAFVQVMFQFGWRDIFKQGTPKLKHMIRRLEEDLDESFPQVLAHLLDESLDLMSCFAQYYVTIFLYDTPESIAVRILDLFLLEREHVIPDLILGMLQRKQGTILALRGEALFRFMRGSMVRECFEEYSICSLFSPMLHEDSTELLELSSED